MLNAWAAVNLSGRLQVLVDVSGSMGEQVPGTGATRMAVTIDAATRGLGLFESTTKIGMWVFDARQNREPGRINTVIVLTDGKDDNASDLTRDQLLAELATLRNPRRPLAIVGIGIRPDVDAAELTAIAEATGGQAFIAPDPSTIGQVFHAALSRMLCQPPACDPRY